MSGHSPWIRIRRATLERIGYDIGASRSEERAEYTRPTCGDTPDLQTRASDFSPLATDSGDGVFGYRIRWITISLTPHIVKV